MISVDDALERIGEAIIPVGGETVKTTDANGRVLRLAAQAAHELPLFDQSAMDGYALRHEDLTDPPVELPVVQTIAATRHDAVPTMPRRTAARIFTGGILPIGADTVIRQELTRASGASVIIDDAVPMGTDVRFRGEELAAGSLIAQAGTVVSAGLIGALVHAGVRTLEVARRPRVRVLVTGDELVDPNEALGIGQIPDSNGPLTAATLENWGVEIAHVGRITDSVHAVETALDEAMRDVDLVITTGGVSVGDYDFVPDAATAIGCETLLWKVAQRPGGPLFVARRGSCLLVGLPGNPAAVHVNLHVYVRLIIDRLLGVTTRRWLRGVAERPMPTNHEKTLWTRGIAHTDDSGRVQLQPLGHQGSHMLSNLARANAIVRVPPGSTPVAAGTTLDWIPLAHA